MEKPASNKPTTEAEPMTEHRVTKWRRLNPERYRDQNNRHGATHRAKLRRRSARIVDMADDPGDEQT